MCSASKQASRLPMYPYITYESSRGALVATVWNDTKCTTMCAACLATWTRTHAPSISAPTLALATDPQRHKASQPPSQSLDLRPLTKALPALLQTTSAYLRCASIYLGLLRIILFKSHGQDLRGIILAPGSGIYLYERETSD